MSRIRSGERKGDRSVSRDFVAKTKEKLMALMRGSARSSPQQSIKRRSHPAYSGHRIGEYASPRAHVQALRCKLSAGATVRFRHDVSCRLRSMSCDQGVLRVALWSGLLLRVGTSGFRVGRLSRIPST